MEAVNFRHFKKLWKANKRRMKGFVTKLENKPPKKLDQISAEVDREVWKEIDCLSCANCCKKMSPTYTVSDIKRISEHLGMTVKEFRAKWLYLDKTGDWMNVSTPCQFLDLNTNMCSIYEHRPVDCAGFPHLNRKKMKDYVHIHKQNIEYCPATYRWIEKMEILAKSGFE